MEEDGPLLTHKKNLIEDLNTHLSHQQIKTLQFTTSWYRENVKSLLLSILTNFIWVYFHLPVHIHSHVYLRRGQDRLHTWCWCGQLPTTAVCPLIQFLPSTPQWLIRKVRGISLSAGWGRGWKYLQSSQEGDFIRTCLVVSRLLSVHADTEREYIETWPCVSKCSVTVLNATMTNTITYKFMSTDITISNRVHTVKMLTELLQNIND